MKTVLLLFFASFAYTSYSQITWSPASNVATSMFGNDHPRIVTDGSGDPLVLWGSMGNVMLSRWNGSTFLTPVQLNPTGMQVAQANWMGPDIVSYGDTIYVVFKEIPETSDTCHVYCLRSFDGGASFSLPVQVTNIGDSLSRFPTVTTDDAGHPVVAFMKFNPSFGEARWVVARSNDFGSTFNTDTKASGWSSMTSDVCDCCPGAITHSGNTFAMMYRDNNSNIRDTWAGISTDNANMFIGGIDTDQMNWMIMSCPSSGPDGFIASDTLYSVFMNGSGGMNRVYYSKAALTTMSSSGGITITNAIPGLSQQNYPRIDRSGNAMAIVWKQIVSGTQMLSLNFSNDFSNLLLSDYDTVALNNIVNTDVALFNGNIWVIWEDDATGTVKYRNGTYSVLGINDLNENKFPVQIFPNPFSDQTTLIVSDNVPITSYEIYGMNGQLIRIGTNIVSNQINISRNELKSGVYSVVLKSGDKIICTERLVVN